MKSWLHLDLLTCILSSPSFRLMLFPKLVGLVLHVCASFSVLDSFMWNVHLHDLCILMFVHSHLPASLNSNDSDIINPSHRCLSFSLQNMHPVFSFQPVPSLSVVLSVMFQSQKFGCWCLAHFPHPCIPWITKPHPSPRRLSSAAAFLLSSPLPNSGLRPCRFPAHLLQLSACFFPSSHLNLPSPFCSSTRVIPGMHKSTHVCPVAAILVALMVKWSLC